MKTPEFFTAYFFGEMHDKLRLSSRKLVSLGDAQNWADFLNSEEQKKTRARRKTHFAFQVFPSKVVWIVNENGDDIRITDGWGDDGCQYSISGNGERVARIGHDGEDFYEAGAFDAHDRPYSEKEKV